MTIYMPWHDDTIWHFQVYREGKPLTTVSGKAVFTRGCWSIQKIVYMSFPTK